MKFNLYDFLNYWDTERGLSIALSGILFLGSTFYWKRPDLLFWDCLIAASALIIFYVIWRVRRSSVILLKRINIIFALHNASKSQEVEKFIINFRHDFEQKLIDLNFKKIRLIFKPSDIQIRSKEEAEKMAQKGFPGHTLVIWTNVQEFKNEVVCKNTNFSYEFAYKKLFPNETPDSIKKRFGQNIDKAMNSLNWNLNLTTRREFETYTDNIKDIGIYTVARSLMTYGEIKKGMDYLLNLLNSFKELNFVEKIKRAILYQ